MHFMRKDIADDHVRILQNLCGLLAALVEKFPGICEAHMTGSIEMDMPIRYACRYFQKKECDEVRCWHARPFYKRDLTQQPGKKYSICNEKGNGQCEVRLGFKNKV